MSQEQNRRNVVKQGGIAGDPSDVEDVTRDTYGDARLQPVSPDHDTRVAEANEAAAAAGMPGATVEPETVSRSDADARDEEVRGMNTSGDSVASRRDGQKLRYTGRTEVTARRGFFPLVVGQDVHLREAGGLIYIAKQNLTVSRGGGQWLVAGRDQTIEQGGGAILLSRQAHVSRAVVGVLIAGRVTVEGGARVLLSLSIPLAAAAATGLAVGLLLGRRRRTPPEPAIPAAF